MKRANPLLIALCFHVVDCACFSTARHAMDYLEETSNCPAWFLPSSGFVALGGAFMKQYIEDSSK